jgi:hypothetical protein
MKEKDASLETVETAVVYCVCVAKSTLKFSLCVLILHLLHSKLLLKHELSVVH